MPFLRRTDVTNILSRTAASSTASSRYDILAGTEFHTEGRTLRPMLASSGADVPSDGLAETTNVYLPGGIPE